MDQLIDQLAQEYTSLSPGLQRAALTILDNPGDVAVDSMRTMASKAHVSPPTMLRLAQRLGFENYESFRDVFKRNFARSNYGARASSLRQATGNKGTPGLIDATVAAAEKGMERFHDSAFVRDIDRIADILINSERSYVIASGASFGQAVSFQYVCQMALPTLELTGKLGLRSVDEMAFVKPGDAVLAITTSPYARTTVDAGIYAKSKGAKVTAVTDSRASPLGRIADAAVIIDTLSPHYFPSMMSLNITLEILSATIAVKRGDAGIGAISDYEGALRANRYYWDDPP